MEKQVLEFELEKETPGTYLACREEGTEQDKGNNRGGLKMAVKEFIVRLSFDLKEFDEKALTKQYVEKIVRRQLGSRGVKIKVEEV